MNTNKYISEYMLEQNEKFHSYRPDYGTFGKKWKKGVLSLKERTDSETILDYGAGKQSLAKSFDFSIQNYDPAVKEISELPSPADLLICTHILEHIEPDLLINILEHIKYLTNKAFLIVVDPGPSNKIMPDGRDSNLIQKSVKEWQEQLKNFFTEFDIININRQKFINQGQFVLDKSLQKGTFVGTKKI